MHPGVIGGIVGGAVGLLGGLIGTYASVKNTNGPRERAFMIKMAVGCWLGVILFLAAILLLPDPYRHLMWIPYGVGFPLFIHYTNKQQQTIRDAEAAPAETTADATAASDRSPG